MTQDEADDLFRPWVVRKARRCLVEWLGNEYFAEALEPFHGREVIVGYDIRDASRVWIREIDLVDGERQPGRLIAVAAFGGNRTRYVPLTAEQAAIERRAKGRRVRLERKLAVVEQELRPALDLAADLPMPAIAAVGGEPVAVEVIEAARLPVAGSGLVATATGRPVFADEVAYARWLIDHPHAADDHDREALREFLALPAVRSQLGACGLDLDTLLDIAA